MRGSTSAVQANQRLLTGKGDKSAQARPVGRFASVADAYPSARPLHSCHRICINLVAVRSPGDRPPIDKCLLTCASANLAILVLCWQCPGTGGTNIGALLGGGLSMIATRFTGGLQCDRLRVRRNVEFFGRFQSERFAAFVACPW